MFALLHLLIQRFGRFQCWFDKRFGWFFTNGMKADRRGPSGRSGLDADVLRLGEEA